MTDTMPALPRPAGPRRRALALAGPLLLLLSGCAQKPAEKPRAGGGAVAVTVAVAEQRDVPVTVAAVGSVEAVNSVEVRARVTGELRRVAFKEGQEVRRGDLLFVIDTRPYEAALAEARANLARDAARAASADADARRYAELVEKDYVTRQQADQLKATADAARATLAADSAAVRSSRLDLDYCTITAPIDGRTGSLLVHEGNMVRSGDAGALVVINQIVPARVSLSVPEVNLPAIRARMAAGPVPVTVTLPGPSGGTVAGQLSFIDNSVDETTGTVRLKALFPNTDQALWPGLFVQASVELGVDSAAVVVPSVAVQPGQAGPFVFVVKPDQTVEMRPVRPGRQVDGHTVLASGVAPGEQVVVDGLMRLSNGAKVNLKPPVGSAPPTGGGRAGTAAAGDSAGRTRS